MPEPEFPGPPQLHLVCCPELHPVDRGNMVSEVIHALQFCVVLRAFGMPTHDRLATLFRSLYFLQMLVIKVIVSFGWPTVWERPLVLRQSIVTYTAGTLRWSHEKRKGLQLELRLWFKVQAF